MTDKTKVSFHKFPDGDVIALMPDEKSGKFITSYMHIGQHSDASPELMTELAHATPDEYVNLLVELSSRGYDIEVMNDYDDDELGEFYMSYVQTALWSSTNPNNDEQLDNGNYELSDEVESEMLADCEAFLAAHADTIRKCVTTRNNNPSNFRMAGHDFWLTRCGHGAGFWDGDYSEPHASILTDASEKAGNVDLYVGDDGKVYS